MNILETNIENLQKGVHLDKNDPLSHFRKRFHFPNTQEPSIYFCGNSLGLQPDMADKYVTEELDKWKNLAVNGHLDSRRPWLSYHEFLTS